MKTVYRILILVIILAPARLLSQSGQPRFRVLTLSEDGGHHIAYSAAARNWLDQLAEDSNFKIDHLHSTKDINASLLGNYQLFIQLDYPPYGWNADAAAALEDYINKGLGGWIGFHHASLLGEFEGFALWPWFYNFMGSVRFKDYIPTFANAKVVLEQRDHPLFRNLPDSFIIEKEEWYTYDQNPRKNVQVLAHVDEGSYQPDSKVKMGDHPVIWSNPDYPARNVYIFMGHSPALFNDPHYVTLFRNAIFWAAQNNK
ncbi:MAG: ThuA domain-containing protein [Chitinophagaceae bacterium]